MRYSGKEAILLLLINALHVNCRIVLKTRNVNETDSPLSLKAYELEEKCIKGKGCENGGTCEPKTGRCYCIEGTSGHYCETIDICKTLGCEDKEATCVFVVETGQPTCKCVNDDYFFEHDKCNECDCGYDGRCQFIEGVKTCYCNVGFSFNGLKCEVCDCGDDGTCRFSEGVKKCECKKGFSFKDGKCQECDCGPNGGCTFEKGFKECYCMDGFFVKEGICTECDCGIYGVCHFEYGEKKCTCVRSTGELNGKCVECDCGLDGSECFFRRNGTKQCFCGHKHIDVNGKCEECYCGPDGLCRFEFGAKKCVCGPGFFESLGKCVAHSTTSVSTESTSLTTAILTSTITSCDCGLGGSCFLDAYGEKICNCFSGYALYDGHCYKCDCGVYGTCSFETGIKRCTCDVNYTEKDGNCEYCSCGENSKSCRYNVLGEKECNCSSAYAQKNGYCEECNCGPYGSCSFEYDRKRCDCKSFAVEKNGVCLVMESTTLEDSTVIRTTSLPSTTQYCNCGEYSKSCRYDWIGHKICDCFPGYVENYGSCDECNCGPYGSCSFEYGRKRCHCREFAIEMNGVCVDKGTSPEETTDSTITYTIGSTTIQDCDCGRLGRCTFENGRKKCICDSLSSEINGQCVECDCGKNTKSCHFDDEGKSVCNCNSGYSQVFGICKECNCGLNARSCFFRRNGSKVCNCDFGYIERNGYCAAICNEDKCINGKCEIDGNSFKCRCNDGFTGHRCEEKVQTKSNKQDLWMVLLLAGVFALVFLVSCMFCVWTRILIKNSKK